jgi:hypothetical protein
MVQRVNASLEVESHLVEKSNGRVVSLFRRDPNVQPVINLQDLRHQRAGNAPPPMSLPNDEEADEGPMRGRL